MEAVKPDVPASFPSTERTPRVRFRAHVIITSPASLGITEHTLPTTYVQSATSAIFCYGSRKITVNPSCLHPPSYFRTHVIMTSSASLRTTEHTLPTTHVQSAIFSYAGTFPASLGTAEYTLPTTYVQSATSAIFCYGSRKTRTSPHRSPAPNEHQERRPVARTAEHTLPNTYVQADRHAIIFLLWKPTTVIMAKPNSDDKGSLMRVPSLVPTIRSESSDDWYLPLPPSTVLYEQYPPPPPLRVSSKSEEQYPPLPRVWCLQSIIHRSRLRRLPRSANHRSRLRQCLRNSTRRSRRDRVGLLEPPTSISSTDESSDVATPPSRPVFIPLVRDRVCAFAHRVAWGAVDDVRAAFRAEQHGETSLTSSSNLMALSRALSSVRMSTIPRSVASIMAPSERAPSSSSLSEVPMRAGFGFWSESSSLGRTLSVLTQSSFLSDSTAPSPSPSPPPLPESPSTHSPSSPRPSRPPSPSSFSLGTPEASGSVSISTPRGDVPSVRSLLDTVPSYRALTEVRGEETQDIVRALRDELRDLADFLHRPTSHPTSPVQVPSPTPIPHAPPPVDRTPSPVAAPEPAIQLLDPPPMNYTSSLLFRTSSNASWYFSSHHSDNGLWSPFPDSLYPGEPSAHISIAGNEAVDAKAKEAAQEASSLLSTRVKILEYPLPVGKAAEATATSAFQMEWKEWVASPRCAKLALFDSASPSNAVAHMYEGLARPQCSGLAQLRTCHIGLNAHLYRIKVAPSQNCVQCSVPQTVIHFLLPWPAYRRESHGTERFPCYPL
ncbi:hypothetical protein C8F04DRAFT_1327376 [Mycena alexandri]|uniref:Uncharacterized protein n=1 Tax=Mycena alexandri TaxID=1745969 RepID=A0AAD6S0T1_9AGAR|nr:hypothetical protein C8F04DRAFT_1327376 [Mycena alexandri]